MLTDVQNRRFSQEITVTCKPSLVFDMKKYGTVCYLKEKQSQTFSQLAPHELFTIEGVRVRHVAWLVKPHLLIFIAKLAAFSNKHLFSFLFWNFFFTAPWIFPILDFGTAGAVRVNCAVWQAYARAYSPVGRVSHDLPWRAHCLENYVFCLVHVKSLTLYSRASSSDLFPVAECLCSTQR